MSQFDRRVLPIVCILYILSYLDRGNFSCSSLRAESNTSRKHRECKDCWPGRRLRPDRLSMVVGPQRFLYLLCSLRVDHSVLETLTSAPICCCIVYMVRVSALPSILGTN